MTIAPVLLLAWPLAMTPPPPPDPPAAPANDLAGAAPQLDWVPEGGDDASSSEADPRIKQRKIRRAAITSVAGGAIVVVGVAGIVGGALMIYMPKAKLAKLESENGGTLPPGNEARQRAITTWEAAPIVLGIGVGLAVVGAVMAGVGAAKVRKLREERRKTVAFAPGFFPGGIGLAAQGRF
jgi:hypothetical protein